jgi:hypothetical protein
VKPGIGGFYSTLVGSDGKSRANLKDQHPLRDVTVGKRAAPLTAGSP